MRLLKRAGGVLLPVVLLLAGLPGAADASPSRCYAVPTSVDATGRADVTSALQAFIDSVPNGACIAFPRRGSYRAEGTISLTDRNNLTLFGNSSTIFATTHGPAWPEPGRQQLVIVGGSHITVKALRIRSVNTSCTHDVTYEFEAGVGIYGAADVRLVNLWIRNVSGDFVYIDARRLPDGFVAPSNITIRNAPMVEPAGRFRCSGRQGIAAGSGAGLVFRNLYLKSTALIPFDLENMREQEIRGVSIIANTVEAPFGAYLVAAASVYGTGTHDVAVRGNRVIGKWLGVALDNNVHSDWTVTGNTSDTPAENELVVLRGTVQNFAFRGNVQPFDPLGAGLVLYLDSVGCVGCVAGYANPCHVFAGGNRLAGAKVLFYPADGQGSCDWADEGGNRFD